MKCIEYVWKILILHEILLFLYILVYLKTFSGISMKLCDKEAFEQIKKAMSTAPVLQFYSLEKPILILCDASLDVLISRMVHLLHLFQQTPL